MPVKDCDVPKLLFHAPFSQPLCQLMSDIGGGHLGELGRVAEQALQGDSRAAAAYVSTYRWLTRALLSAAAESRPDTFAVDAAGHVAMRDCAGVRAGWIEAALDDGAGEAPFSRWAALLGLREGVAMFALASLRALVPDSHPLDAPATGDLLEISDLHARRFLRGVRRCLNADEPALEHIQEIFALNNTELGGLFGVTRQGVKDWIERGVPAERQERVATVAAIADLLQRKLKPERIAGIARRPADAYGGLTMLDLIRQEREHELLELTRRSFDWATAA